MTKQEALRQALDEMNALSPEELRAELDKFKGSDFSNTLRQMGEVSGLIMNQYPEFSQMVINEMENKESIYFPKHS